MTIFNPFILRKYAALLSMGFFPSIFFAVGVLFYSFWIGLGTMTAGMLCGFLISSLLLKHPFTKMLEGKGILAIDLNSSGVMRPFIVTVAMPFVYGKVQGKPMQDIFDRTTVMNLAAPVENKITAQKKDGNIHFTLNEDEYNKSRFQMFHYPVLLWNSAINSIITKDFLADSEKDAFAEHGILYMNKKVEELSSSIRDFARYVVEMTRPQGSIWDRYKWIIVVGMILVGVLVIFIIIKISPQLFSAFGGVGGAADAIKTAAGTGSSVIPK